MRGKLGDGISSHNFRHTFASMLIVAKAKHGDEFRDRFEKGYGHLLGDVNIVATEDGNRSQSEPSAAAEIAASVG